MDVSSVALCSKTGFLEPSPSPIVVCALCRLCTGRAVGVLGILETAGRDGEAGRGENRAAAKVAAMLDGDRARGTARPRGSGTSSQPGELVKAEAGELRAGVELPVNWLRTTLRSEELVEEADTLREAAGFFAANVAPANAPLVLTSRDFFSGSGAGFFLLKALDAPSSAAFCTLCSVLP